MHSVAVPYDLLHEMTSSHQQNCKKREKHRQYPQTKEILHTKQTQ